MSDVLEWGLRDYAESLRSMRALRVARRKGEIPDTLILVEHPSVITVGVQGAEGETFPPDLPLVHVERGGHATYHGPGQLVGYPIVDLEPRSRDVRRFVGDVEELVIRSLAEVGVRAGRVPGQRGVWVDGSRKIASVGIAVEQWVTFHGFALNVGVDLDTFRRFRPCGMDGGVMTSVSQEVARPVATVELVSPVVRGWRELFGGGPARPTTGPAASTIEST